MKILAIDVSAEVQHVNTTERIVEAYFRICRRCFTSPDVKIPAGNNRQLDLLAYNLREGQVFHVETSVTHCTNWCPSLVELEQLFDYKFLGRPKPNQSTKSDYAKGKTYLQQIHDTYRSFGIDPDEIRRVFCCWVVSGEHDVAAFAAEYCAARGLTRHPIEILSFRDTVIPNLQKSVGTSNYEDDVLRTFSLLREHELQTARLAARLKVEIGTQQDERAAPSLPSST